MNKFGLKYWMSGLLVAMVALTAWSQGTIQPKQLDGPTSKGVVYNKEVAMDIRLHTNGYAVGVNFGTLRTYYQTRYFYGEFGELKHHKENRTNSDRSSAAGGISRAFIYGKQNNLFALRGGIGEKRYFSEKADEKGVAVGISYRGGATLGLLKPYYLELVVPDNQRPPFTTTESVKYSEEIHARFLNPWNIFGASSWLRGWDEVRVLPGLHGQVAVHVDWGAFDDYVKAVEMGIMADVFFQKVPIMIEVDEVENRPFFLNLFINLQFGKRR
jgi:hypothetical protein